MLVGINTEAMMLYGELRPPLNLDATLKTIEEHLIQRVLQYTGDNKKMAAKILGVKRTTLIEKVRRLAELKRAKQGWAIEVLP